MRPCLTHKYQSIDFILESPRIPRRRSSFNHSATTQAVDNGEQQVDAGPARHRHLRQGISSNTWTSSSGGGSNDDGNDDRRPFVRSSEAATSVPNRTCAEANSTCAIVHARLSLGILTNSAAIAPSQSSTESLCDSGVDREIPEKSLVPRLPG